MGESNSTFRFGGIVFDVVRSADALRSNETALASEPVLRRDWDRPEDDEAWSKL